MYGQKIFLFDEIKILMNAKAKNMAVNILVRIHWDRTNADVEQVLNHPEMVKTVQVI